MPRPIATLVALLWVSTVAIVFAVYGGNVSLVGFLAIAPFIAAAFARPSRVALVGHPGRLLRPRHQHAPAHLR